jgi:NAD-dependent oxidoreductase involved in siderophore biosynthesis
MKANVRYITLNWRSFLPVVAVLWPRAKAEEFKEWADEHPTLPGQREPRSDDAMGGRWKMLTRQTVKATVPSLVEHPDQVPSLIGRRAMWGKDRGRVAAFLAADGLEYEW